MHYKYLNLDINIKNIFRKFEQYVDIFLQFLKKNSKYKYIEKNINKICFQTEKVKE